MNCSNSQGMTQDLDCAACQSENMLDRLSVNMGKHVASAGGYDVWGEEQDETPRHIGQGSAHVGAAKSRVTGSNRQHQDSGGHVDT